MLARALFQPHATTHSASTRGCQGGRRTIPSPLGMFCQTAPQPVSHNFSRVSSGSLFVPVATYAQQLVPQCETPAPWLDPRLSVRVGEYLNGFQPDCNAQPPACKRRRRCNEDVYTLRLFTGDEQEIPRRLFLSPVPEEAEDEQEEQKEEQE